MPKYMRPRKSKTHLSLYPIEHHGPEQTKRYLKMLRDCMKDVADNPNTKGT